MGEVYRARDTRLGREVALKVASESLGGGSDLLERLEREARLESSLSHPNVVAVHDVGLHEGCPFFVTELLHGETLRARLARGPVPLATALDWAAQMASGLAAAHARGVVHRDLKPENVFITREGYVKLLDFGIAKLTDEARAGAPSRRDALMDRTAPVAGRTTEAGRVLGTPGYMSPEQVRGDPVDARTDFFSLGVVLYELFSGRRAFPSGPAVEVGHAILHDDPEPLPPQVPSSLARLIERCLQKDPQDRYQSARDLAFNLELLRNPSSAALVPVKQGAGPGRGWWWLGALAAVLGLVAMAVATRRPAVRVAHPVVQRLTFRPGAVFSARFTQGGRSVVLTANWGGEPLQVYSMSLSRPGVRADYHSLGIGPAVVQSVSPSGELAVVVRPDWTGLSGGRGTLARVPGVGGSPREIVTSVQGADWAPDGLKLAIVRSGEAGDVLEYPIGRVLHQSSTSLSHPVISRSGDRVAVVEIRSGPEGPGDLLVIGADGKPRTLLKDWFINGAAWAPGDSDLWISGSKPGIYENEALWAISPDGTQRLLYKGTGNLVLEDVDVDGRALVRAYEASYDVKVVGLDGGPSHESLAYFDTAVLADLSQDGRKVLFTENDDWGLESVYLRETAGTSPVRLGAGRGLALSPDGTFALALDPGNGGRLLKLPTGAGATRNIELRGMEVARARLSKKRGIAIILAKQDGATKALLLDLERGATRPVTPPLVCCAFAVSPDGTQVAARPVGATPLSVYPVSGGDPIELSELGRDYLAVDWTDHGLVVRPATSVASPLVELFGVDLRTRTRRLLATLSAGEPTALTRIRAVRVTPDEKTVAYQFGRYSSFLYLVDLGRN